MEFWKTKWEREKYGSIYHKKLNKASSFKLECASDAMESRVLKSTQIFIVATIVLITLFITLLCIGFLVRYEVANDVSSLRSVVYWNDKISKEQEIWFNRGIDELQIALNLHQNNRKATNVIVFVASGVGNNVLAAARFRGSLLPNTTVMSWDTFPHLGLLKHDCNPTKPCEPLSRATALFSGIKSNYRMVGLDSTISLRNCSATFNSSHHIKSIVQLAQEAGKRTGFITTGRVTAPYNAALYAHVADADWECDATMTRKKRDEGCRDIALELMETQTGRDLNVIMGGGRQTLVANAPTEINDPLDDFACNSRDRRNLIRDWQKQKKLEKTSHVVLKESIDLARLNGSRVDYALGIFANGNLHRKYKAPSLKEMVSKAITILNRPQGFLMVVNAIVDADNAQQAKFHSIVELNEAVAQVLDMIQNYSQNTLMVVLFENSAGNSFQNFSSDDPLMKLNNRASMDNNILHDFVPDTILLAQGPKAHLLQGVHDETYLAHVIRYALNIGSLDK